MLEKKRCRESELRVLMHQFNTRIFPPGSLQPDVLVHSRPFELREMFTAISPGRPLWSLVTQAYVYTTTHASPLCPFCPPKCENTIYRVPPSGLKNQAHTAYKHNGTCLGDILNCPRAAGAPRSGANIDYTIYHVPPSGLKTQKKRLHTLRFLRHMRRQHRLLYVLPSRERRKHAAFLSGSKLPAGKLRREVTTGSLFYHLPSNQNTIFDPPASKIVHLCTKMRFFDVPRKGSEFSVQVTATFELEFILTGVIRNPPYSELTQFQFWAMLSNQHFIFGSPAKKILNFRLSPRFRCLCELESFLKSG
ncbi:hypothetical protein C8R43DRAFT_953618 [Mycena crocata]|nr:hypothetical protein C8R43DRAFT_953618 [Mycena crocata]